jgi:hypothetical protein
MPFSHANAARYIGARNEEIEGEIANAVDTAFGLGAICKWF